MWTGPEVPHLQRGHEERLWIHRHERPRQPRGYQRRHHDGRERRGGGHHDAQAHLALGYVRDDVAGGATGAAGQNAHADRESRF